MVVASNWGIGGSDPSVVRAPKRSAPPYSVAMSVNQDNETSSQLPRAILLCRPNSHPFHERCLTLSQPVKVGRSVARARVTPNNAIFECKVLSRNHALLWYENGKFFLQDTKSSNGTFVNNQRLSQGGMESTAYELSSGDIVQFGVDVMENTRKACSNATDTEHVTHGCIVATLKLFLPDGKEAKASQISNAGLCNNIISTEDIYQLNQYVQEAAQREQQLEGKLIQLQNIVDTTQKSAQQAWHCLLQEDRLLTRIDVLESQLAVYTNNSTDDKLREEIVQMLNDKLKYQETAKEALRQATEEKLCMSQRNGVLEVALCSAEEDRDNTNQTHMKTQQDLQELASRFGETQQQIRDLTISRENYEQTQMQVDVLLLQLAECRHSEMIGQGKLLCAEAQILVISNRQNICQSRKTNKMEKSQIFENEICNMDSDSLLMKIEHKMDFLQRHLMELTEKLNVDKPRPNQEQTDESIHNTDLAEEMNDNCSDLTVIDNDLSLNSSHGSEVSLTSKSSMTDIINNEDNNVNEFPVNGMSPDNSNLTRIEQIKKILLDLKVHRDLIQTSLQEMSKFNNEVIKTPENIELQTQQQQQQNDQLELQGENERLKDVIQSFQQQMKYYENEIDEFKQKLETIGIELETRPSYNSVQEKESLCLDQQMAIESLKLENVELKQEIVKCNSIEMDMKNRLSQLQNSSKETEVIIKTMEAKLFENEESLKHLKEKLKEKKIKKQAESLIKDCLEKTVQTENTSVNGSMETKHETIVKQEFVNFENSVQKDLEFLSDPNVQLEEELVLIKERFLSSLQESNRLTDQLAKLQLDCDTRVSRSRTMMIVYIGPIIALVFYLLLSPYMSSVSN